MKYYLQKQRNDQVEKFTLSHQWFNKEELIIKFLPLGQKEDILYLKNVKYFISIW